MLFDFTYSSRRSLPSDWAARNRSAYASSTYLKVEGLSVKYIGEGREDSQAASVRANHAIPKDLPLYYYELRVVNAGQKGFIGIGFCTEDSNLGRLPGWEAHTYGYHGDDGHAFNGPGRSIPYGPTYTTGDVIGALYDAIQHTISFFKNGKPLGVAFRGVQESTLFPMVGLRSPDEEVVVNFGASGYSVDVAGLLLAAKQRLMDSILAVQLPLTTAGASSAAAAGAAGRGGGSDGQGGGSSGPAEGRSSQQQQQQQRPGEQQQMEELLDDKGPTQMEVDRDPGVAALLEALLGQPAAQQQQQQQPNGSSSSSRSSKDAAAQPLLPALVFEYLLHHRCWQTAEVVARDVLCLADSRKERAAQGGGTPAEQLHPHKRGSALCSSRQEPDGDVAMGDGEDEHPHPAAASSSSGQHSKAAAAAAAAAAAGGSEATPSSSGVLSAAQVADAVVRQQVYDRVLQGHLDEAAGLLEQHCGDTFLQQRPRLLFRLRLQQFVELLRSQSASAEAVLLYGRRELGPLVAGADEEEMLAEALSLLAYADPAASPCAHLLRPSQRQQLADELNGAMLEAQGRPAVPLLQQLYRQLVVVMEELKRQGSCAAMCLDVPELLLSKKG